MMRNAFFLLILFVFVGCNSKEAALTSIQGMRDPNNPIPQIVSILPQGPGTYAVGAGLDFYVTYDDVVVVDGNPRLMITADSGTYYADYISGSGTNILYFQFIVPAGAFDYNGIQLTGLMNLNGGSIYDPDDDDDSKLTYAAPSTTAVLINGIDPVITSITIDNGNYKIGDTLEFTVNYSYPVFVTGTPTLPIKIGLTDTQANYVSGNTTRALKFSYPVSAHQDYDGVDTRLGTMGLVGATITDYFGDNAGAIFTVANYPAVIHDGVAPVENSRMTPIGATKFLGNLLLYTVSYLEIVHVSGSPRVQLNIGGTTRYANYFSGSGTPTISFAYSVASDDLDMDGITEVIAIDLNGGAIKDRAGNLFTGVSMPWPAHNINVDGIIPTLTAVGMAGGNYKIGDVIEVHATYSEIVTVTGLPSIGINIGGTTKQAVYHSGTATNDLTFKYTIQEGLTDTDGITTISPISLNGGTIKDLATNAASVTFTASTTAGALVDAVRPTISISTIPTVAPLAIWRPGNTMGFIVTATENLTISGGTPSLSLSVGSNTRAASLSSSSTNTMSFSYTVNASDMDLNGITLNSNNVILNGASIRDSFGNDAVLTLAAVDMSKVFVLPNEIKYWFDASDTLTTTGSTTATTFKSKADPISPSLTGGAPALVTGPNGTKFAQFTGANNFTLTMADADVVITTVKTPSSNGSVWRSIDLTKSIRFDYFILANTVYTGAYCNAWCEFFKPTNPYIFTVSAANALSPYSFVAEEYRTIAVDFKSPASSSYKIGEFNGRVGEMFILSSGSSISPGLIQAIGDYMNAKHGASW